MLFATMPAEIAVLRCAEVLASELISTGKCCALLQTPS